MLPVGLDIGNRFDLAQKASVSQCHSVTSIDFNVVLSVREAFNYASCFEPAVGIGASLILDQDAVSNLQWI